MKNQGSAAAQRVIVKCQSILTKQGLYNPKDMIRFPRNSKAVPAVRAAICYVLYHHYGFKHKEIIRAMNINSVDSLRNMLKRIMIKRSEKGLDQIMYAALCKGLKAQEVYHATGPSDKDISIVASLSENVIQAVCKACVLQNVWVEPMMVTGSARFHEVVVARHISAYILRSHYSLPLELIGITLGGKDHATILYANRVTPIRIQSEPLVSAIYRKTCETLGIEPRFGQVVEAKKTERISDMWPRSNSSTPKTPIEVIPDDEPGGYIVPKNWTAEEKAKIAEVKRNGGFSPFSL
jgi:hypothetical protein